MASSSSSSSSSVTIIISFFLFFYSSTTTAGAQSTGFDRGPEKQTHVHLFFHDVLSGSSRTAVQIISPSASTSSSTGFGTVTMIDDVLTEGIEADSKLIGRAQGIYAIASEEEAALLMTMNFAFTDGEFKGSSIAVVGRNPVAAAVREMPVVGGSGKFRWARGYALATTRRFDPTTGDATVEYDVYVIHR